MSKKIVLFVDDDEKVLRSWRRHFADEPYGLLFARSGKEALRILEGISLSVVVSDYSMPEGNGIELFSKLKKDYPNVARILVSGQATLKVASEAINDCGVYKLFEKPCSPIDLAVSIREALRIMTDHAEIESKSASLASLEREHPGITKVRRGRGGVIEIDQ